MAKICSVGAGVVIFMLWINNIDKTSCYKQVDLVHGDRAYDRKLANNFQQKNFKTPAEKLSFPKNEWNAQHYGIAIGVVLLAVAVVIGTYFRTDGGGGRAVDAGDLRAMRLRKLGSKDEHTCNDVVHSPNTVNLNGPDKVPASNNQQTREQDVQMKNRSPKRSSSSLKENRHHQRPLNIGKTIAQKSHVQDSVPQMPVHQSDDRATVHGELLGRELAAEEQKQAHQSEQNGMIISDGLVIVGSVGNPHGQNVRKKKESVAKDLPIDSLIKKILPQLLDCTLEFQENTETHPLRKVSRIIQRRSGGKVLLDLQASEIPSVEEEINKKLEKLLSKRMCAEMDPLKFAIECFDRCTRQPMKVVERNSNGLLLWREITAVVMEHCVNTTIKHLVRVAASPTSVEDDLWADFEPSGQSEVPLNYFLGCLGGWSRDGVSVSFELLDKLLEKGKENEDLKQAFVDMVTTSGSHIAGVKRLNEVMFQCGGIFRGLETLMSQPLMARFMAEALEKESKESVQEMGVFFQDKSMFSSFLSMTSIEAKVDRKSRASVCFAELPNFPQVHLNEVQPVQAQILDGIHSCQNTVHKALLNILLQPEYKECALAWISTVVSLNEMRLFTRMASESVQQVVASDGFMLNLCTVLLQLCEPFFIGKRGSKFKQIEPSYCTSDACRLPYENERSVVGGQICKEGEEKSAEPFQKLFLPEELRGKHKLTTEMFHITHRALHIGLTSTLQHYRKLLRQYLNLHEMKQGTPLEAETKSLLMLFTLQWDTCMQDGQLIRLCSQFYLTSAVWLQQLLDRCCANSEGLSEKQVHMKQQEIFSTIPEFYVKSMCSWFRYVSDHRPSYLRGLDICLFVDCCVSLIQRPDLMPGPVAATRIVSCLLSFIECTSRKKRKNNLLDTNSWGSGVEGDLHASVTMCPAVREKLGPALIHTYSSVDVVEGLDVDKEDFDKFSARYEIVKLLEHLWDRPDCRGSLLAECGRPNFQAFLGAILDTLLYLLDDALSRLTNVRSLQNAQEDAEKWSKLSQEERMEKEQFLKNEEHVSKSFMETANVTLAFLEKITEETLVARCFNEPPLSQRSSCVILGFLETLCGHKSLDLKVKNMEKYSFNPHDLLLKIVTVLIRISKGACPNKPSVEAKLKEIDECMAIDPDYCKSTMEKALRVLRGHLSDSSPIVQELEELVFKVDLLIKMKENALAKAKACKQLDGNEAVNGELHHVEPAKDDYVTALEDEKFAVVELLETHAYLSCSSQPISPRAGKVRALMREATQLRDSLPIHPNAAIFVRQDENRMDFARALITGPVDTPYSRGCFIFDIYFPATYPVDPPLVKLITTGMGTVRFNPNLYQDGKVCLSLLGTWHGGDASEKWDSQKSSLYQVLVSIQGMIFIPDPCFNEPGYQGIQGTEEGDAMSEKCNAGIRLATVRHAMVGQLRDPPVGCEQVIHTHFRLQKELVLKQCAEWLQQCAGDQDERRMLRAVDDLKHELDKL